MSLNVIIENFDYIHKSMYEYTIIIVENMLTPKKITSHTLHLNN